MTGVCLLMLGLGLGLVVAGVAVLVAARIDDQRRPRLYPPLHHPNAGRRGD